MNERARSVVAILAVALVGAAALARLISAGPALILGTVVALTLGNPWPARTKAIAARMLTWSVVGLGAGMDLRVIGRVGLHGLGYTAAGIGIALSVGTWAGRRLAVGRDVALLISVGTSICGGSAIAAVAPVIRADERDVSMAIVTVFLLNAVALLIFPPIGHALDLSQGAFGLWCALAIHDTSSVVGAAAKYGDVALGVATAAKLARALWIIPVAFGISYARARASVGTADRAKPKKPWFIAGFLAMATVVMYVPALAPAGRLVSDLAHRTLTLTLLLIGLGLSRSSLRALGPRPLLLGVILWVVLGSSTLLAIVRGYITT